jgi:hypothetical protein
MKAQPMLHDPRNPQHHQKSAGVYSKQANISHGPQGWTRKRRPMRRLPMTSLAWAVRRLLLPGEDINGMIDRILK